MGRYPRAAALLGAVFCCFGPAWAGQLPSVAAPPTAAALVRQFDDVVFGREHGSTAQIIRKWKTMPGVAFFASPQSGPPPLEAVSRHLKAISDVTGLDFPRAKAPGAAALRVGFFPRQDFANLPRAEGSDQAEYDRFVGTSACLGIAATSPSAPGDLAVGAVMIGTDIDANLQRHCILEELVQITGLANDSCDYRPSLFCEDDHVMEMTPADRVLLRTLYDVRLTPGMTRLEAMPIAAAIIAEQMGEP